MDGERAREGSATPTGYVNAREGQRPPMLDPEEKAAAPPRDEDVE